MACALPNLSTKGTHMGKLGRLKKALQHCWKQYRKRGKQLEKGAKQQFTEAFHELEEAITKRDVTRGKVWREKLEDLCKTHIPRSWLRATVELVVAIAVALAIATVIRQSWFELYEIPTGSMRPTFREQDHLSVTKTPFGINIPLETEHFYFDPDLVQRGSVVIFSTDKMPVADSDTTFFGIFPYKKRLVKRMIGKPGDTLYFYGGKIYGLDSEGNPIDILLNEPSMAKLDHIPFISFEGTPSQPKRDQIVFSQMNIPVGRLTRRPTGDWKATVFQG
ncbi:MAG: signal peptidase I, partial [Chlamydiia bacterium]|nr:signal peptidase I [Chlamydiia bacterium]